MDSELDTPLKPLLLERVSAKGRITFAEFMAAALYEPGLGYYTSAGRKVGAEGDFYTSINVSVIFGRLIAREVIRMWQVMGEPERFEIVEVGAAGGRLACDLLDTIAELAPPLYERLRLLLIEKEPSLMDAQREALSAHLTKIGWHGPDELRDGKLHVSGCFYSNELIDSFPTHLVEMTRDGLREVFVEVRDGEFAEVLDTPSTPRLETYFREIGARLAVGQRAEANLNAPEWLASVANALERGFVLTIDYGYLAPELYGHMRQNGTLLCYYRHTLEENPLLRPGRQDITSHVDFTTLIAAGESLGLARVWYGEQYRFLMATGMMEEMMLLETRAMCEQERVKNRLVLKKLILPEGGMGDTFKVLVQAKGIENPQLLCLRDWSAAL